MMLNSFLLIALFSLIIYNTPIVCHSISSVKKRTTSLSVSKIIQQQQQQQQVKVLTIRGGAKKKLKPSLIKRAINFFLSFFGKNSKSKARYPGTETKKKSSSSKGKSGGTSSENRLQKEIKTFLESPPLNCELVVGHNIRTWVVKITGLEGTIYAGEKFQLKMVFPKDYPSKRKY